MKKNILIGAAVLLLAPAVAFAESGTVTRPAQILAAPYSDAASKGMLREQQSVEIIERQGGWYNVKADDGSTGWLRLSSIRLGAAEKEEESGGFWASVFSFTGRSQARTASATTGIRGLSAEEIQAAEPNPAAVERLASFAPDDRATRAFAASIGLKAQNVAPIPERDETKKKGGSK